MILVQVIYEGPSLRRASPGGKKEQAREEKAMQRGDFRWRPGCSLSSKGRNIPWSLFCHWLRVCVCVCVCVLVCVCVCLLVTWRDFPWHPGFLYVWVQWPNMASASLQQRNGSWEWCTKLGKGVWGVLGGASRLELFFSWNKTPDTILSPGGTALSVF